MANRDLEIALRLRADMKDGQAAVEALAAAIRDVGSKASEAGTGLQKVGATGAVDQAQGAIDKLGHSLDGVSAKASEAGKGLQKVGTTGGVDQAQAPIDKLGHSLDGVSDKASEASKDLQKVGATGAVDQAQASVDRLGQSLDSTGKRAGDASRQITQVGESAEQQASARRKLQPPLLLRPLGRKRQPASFSGASARKLLGAIDPTTRNDSSPSTFVLVVLRLRRTQAPWTESERGVMSSMALATMPGPLPWLSTAWERLSVECRACWWQA